MSATPVANRHVCDSQSAAQFLPILGRTGIEELTNAYYH
jgi:hypothetical protein